MTIADIPAIPCAQRRGSGLRELNVTDWGTTTMNKKLLTVAVSSALAAPMAAQAVKYKLSGQVNRAAVYHNDGQQSDVQFVDNVSSGTRWRMTGSEDIGSGMKVGFNWEWQRSSNPGASAGPIRSSGTGDSSDSNTFRRAEVWFSGGWGKVSLGQGDGAGNGTTEVDLSSTWNVAYVGRASFGGGIAWRTSSGAGITATGTVSASSTSALTHGDTFDNFDAFGRYDRIRYDSPALGPVTLSVSAGQADKYEGAVRWSQGLGGGQISAALFYGRTGGSIENRYGGSAAYLFSFGTNIQASYSENEPILASGATGTKGKNWYVKVGHNWGNNSVSVGYGESKDVTVGFKDKGGNVGYNYNIPKAKVDLYAGLAWNQLDVPGALDVDDIYTVSVGTKLKFD
jgi:predicted porin